MIQTITLFPGVTLRCYPDHRFKHGCLSVQLVRPMCREEAALNALIPAVLLRGTVQYRDLRAITLRLDDLYGASIGTLVRRVGDYQTTGLYCSFMEDKYALPGDRVLEPLTEFLGQLLLEPVEEDGGFSREFVESEKKNLIATIEAELNDKRAYAAGRMLRSMCREDSYGVDRLGDREQVAAVDPVGALTHYRRILRESPVELFYVGAAPAETVAGLLRRVFARIPRDYIPAAAQTGFRGPETGEDMTERMEVSQGKLCLGLTTGVTNRDPGYGAMQMLNAIFGAGMTSKLFMQVREKMSLCYSIGSAYYGAKGIMTVSAGIDCDRDGEVKAEILNQLEACRNGQITDEEMDAAREAIFSGLRSVHDSPGAIEGYYAVVELSGGLYPQPYMQAVANVTREQVAEAARKVRLHTSYFLTGVEA